MAAGWLQHLAGDKVDVYSGGSQPADSVTPVAIEAMAEQGLDIGANAPRRWSDETLRAADVVVTMGCGDECPYYPGKRYVDWDLEDPSGKGIEEVRRIRDEIERRVRNLMEELGVQPNR